MTGATGPRRQALLQRGIATPVPIAVVEAPALSLGSGAIRADSNCCDDQAGTDCEDVEGNAAAVLVGTRFRGAGVSAERIRQASIGVERRLEHERRLAS